MIASLIFLIVPILIVLWIYIFYKNDRVYYFTTSFNHLLFDELKRILDTYKDDDELREDINNYHNIKEKVYYLLDKHSYNKYVFSFKPLKLEKWFTKEDLEFIAYLKQYRK